MTTTIPTWTLGDRLTKAREMADISVSDMAARLRVHRNTISNWENDKVVPPYAAVLAWSDITAVPVSWLEDREPTDRAASAGYPGQMSFTDALFAHAA